MDKRFLKRQILVQLLKTDPAALAGELFRLTEIVEERLALAKGDKGDDGKPGYCPIKGKDYFDGIDGYTPVKGRDYFDGEDGYTPVKGTDYRDGIDGKDALVDYSIVDLKVAEVRKELERLIEEKTKEDEEKDLTLDDVFKAIEERKIDAKFIKGFKHQVIIPAKKKEKIDFSDQRWHGGGLTASGIYTQTPVGTIDGNNKVFTVAHTINNVIGFALNGMFVHPVEYTTSGTTITFVTAPDISLSGTSFSITYV